MFEIDLLSLNAFELKKERLKTFSIEVLFCA
ncbi:Uncharacterised protein [Acinetobacter baumannii]|nr:Uncharacterised protein [Acinetobacter baumannii]